MGAASCLETAKPRVRGRHLWKRETCELGGLILVLIRNVATTPLLSRSWKVSSTIQLMACQSVAIGQVHNASLMTLSSSITRKGFKVVSVSLLHLALFRLQDAQREILRCISRVATSTVAGGDVLWGRESTATPDYMSLGFQADLHFVDLG